MNSPDFLPTLYIIAVYHPPVSGALRRQAGFAFGYSVRLVSPVGASVRKPTQPVAKSRSRIPTASEAENSISSGIHSFHTLSPLCKSNTPCLSCRVVSSGATFVFLSNTLFLKKLYTHSPSFSILGKTTSFFSAAALSVCALLFLHFYLILGFSPYVFCAFQIFSIPFISIFYRYNVVSLNIFYEMYKKQKLFLYSWILVSSFVTCFNYTVIFENF